MRHQYLTVRRRGSLCQRRLDRLGIGGDLRIGVHRPDMSRTDKGQQPHCHCAVLVFQEVRDQLTIIHRRKIHPSLREQPSAEGQTLGGIVVAADEKDRDLLPGQGGEKVVQQGHSLSRRQGAVIDVPGNEHCIRPLLPGNIQDLPENIPLILQQRDIIKAFADVQVP